MFILLTIKVSTRSSPPCLW